VPAAFGATLGVVGLSMATTAMSPRNAGIGSAALLVLVLSMRRLLPAGVAVARAGVATVVGCRGLCGALFLTPTAYLPLMLTSTHHWSLTAAGIPLMAGSVGWSAAAGWQGRHPDLPRHLLLRIGFCALTVAMLGCRPWRPPGACRGSRR
jgi:hypothetical protein